MLKSLKLSQSRRSSLDVNSSSSPVRPIPAVSAPAMTSKELEDLRKYSACDISDALLALDTTSLPRARRQAGFLHDLVLQNPSPPSYDPSTARTKIYPTFTVQFQPLLTSISADALPKGMPNVPAGQQWSDLVKSDTIVVIQQPLEQKNACVGGIHMMRLFKRGVKGLIVEGRIRDLSQCREIEMPVWSKGVSVVGAGAECRVHAIKSPVTVSDIKISSGDVICMDEIEGGVVCIPQGSVGDVLEWLRKRGDSEDHIMEYVSAGGSVTEAFKMYR